MTEGGSSTTKKRRGQTTNAIGKKMNEQRGDGMSDDDITERFLERAAIMEYDGGMTRIEATTECYDKLTKWCKRVGRTVPQAIIDDFERVKGTN